MGTLAINPNKIAFLTVLHPHPVKLSLFALSKSGPSAAVLLALFPVVLPHQWSPCPFSRCNSKTLTRPPLKILNLMPSLVLPTASFSTKLSHRHHSTIPSATHSRRPHLAGDPPRTVVITSGKGGVGKTTATANLSASLARLGFRVTSIDADAGLRNLDLLLGLENRIHYTASEVFSGECRLDQALVRDRRFNNLRLLCLSKPRSKLPLSFGSKTITYLVDALKTLEPENPVQFILIDCPAGVDAGFVTAIAPADEAILVTTPDITALRDADRVAGLLECDGIKDIKIIVNRVRADLVRGEDMMSPLDVQEMLGLPLLGAIPEDAEVIRSTNRGSPLVLNDPPAPAGIAFEQAAWRLVEGDTMTAVALEEADRPAKKGFGWFSFFGR